MPQKNQPYVRCAYKESGFDCFGRYSDEGKKSGFCHILSSMPKGASESGECPFYKPYKEKEKRNNG